MQNSQKKAVKKISPKYLGIKKKLLIIFIIEGIVFSLASVFATLSFQWIIDYASAGDAEKLTYAVGVCILLYIFSYGLYLFDSYLFQKIIRKITDKLKKEAFVNICHLPMEDYGSNSSSYYLNVFQNDIPIVVSSYFENILSLISQLSGLVLSIIFTFLVSWVIGLVIVFIAIIATIVPRVFEKKLEKMIEKNLKKSEKYLNKLQNLLGAFELIKVYNLFKKAESMHDKEIDSYSEDSFKLKIKNIKINLIASMFAVLAYISVFVGGAYLLVYGYGMITIGAIVALSQMIGNIMSPVEQIPSTIIAIRTSKPVRERVDKVLKIKPQMQVLVNETEINEIEFKNVSFKYKDKEKFALTDFNFKFCKNKKYLIVGESGSGKSTLNKLLLGLLKPTQGQVFINGITDNSEVSLINKHITYMNQDPFIFEESVKNNITLFEDCDDKRYNEAIKFAKIDRLISSLPSKSETNVGEQGSKLSGGEKQRICIARTKYHSSDIVVLDEFTSNLDLETTYSLFNDLAKDDTTGYIIVMHNLSRKIVVLFDEIIILKDGIILESGNVIKLLERIDSYLNSLLKIA